MSSTLDKKRLDLAELISRRQARGDESPELLKEYYSVVEASVHDLCDEILGMAHDDGRLELKKANLICDIGRFPYWQRKRVIAGIALLSIFERAELHEKVGWMIRVMEDKLDGPESGKTEADKAAQLYAEIKSKKKY